jgi:two-component system, sensor histidine kinase RegB
VSTVQADSAHIDTLKSGSAIPRASGRAVETPPAWASAAINLRRLVALRIITLTGLALVTWVAVAALDIVLPLIPLTATLTVALLVIVATALRLRHASFVRDEELFAHLILDVLVLTAAFYYSGGSTNPFATLYLIPLTLTAAALSRRYVWGMLALIVGCYSLLLKDEHPLYHAHDGQLEHVLDDFNLYVAGTWLALLLSGGLIAHFAVRMRESVRERDRLRALIREQELKHERVLALGTFAAGAAHELSTPLATIAILAKELSRSDTTHEKELKVLRAQVDRCKEILGSLTVAVGSARAEGGGSYPVDTYLSELGVRWRATHDKVSLEFRADGPTPAPRLVVDATLTQAIHNLLNNAADVSPVVEFDAQWDASRLTLEIRDRGPGLSAEASEHAGEPFFTTKEPGAGMGLGLFLARGTIERLGGMLTLKNRVERRGAACRVELPLET